MTWLKVTLYIAKINVIYSFWHPPKFGKTSKIYSKSYEECRKMRMPTTFVNLLYLFMYLRNHCRLFIHGVDSVVWFGYGATWAEAPKFNYSLK